MNWDNTDFLEHFDKESIIKTNNNTLYKYSITKEQVALTVMLDPKKNKVFIYIDNLTELEIYNIECVRCDKQYDVVKLVFFKKDKEFPYLFIFIQPYISVTLDLEQTGFC